MRFEKYITVRPSTAMVAIIVEIMVQVISILGIATKEMKEGFISRSFLLVIYPNLTFRTEKLFKRLFGINRLKDALQQLDKLAPEEALMAGADTQVIAAQIHENVTDMAANVVGIEEGVKDVHVIVAGVNDKVESAHVETQAIHRQVGVINTGDIYCTSLTRRRVLILTISGVTEVREGIQMVLRHVDDRNCW